MRTVFIVVMLLSTLLLGCSSENNQQTERGNQVSNDGYDSGGWRLEEENSPMDGKTLSALYSSEVASGTNIEMAVVCHTTKKEAGALFSLASDDGSAAFQYSAFKFGSSIRYFIAGRVKLGNRDPQEIYHMMPIVARTDYKNVATLVVRNVQDILDSENRATGRKVSSVEAIRLSLPLVVELNSTLGPAQFIVPANNQVIEEVLSGCETRMKLPAEGLVNAIIAGKYKANDEEGQSAEIIINLATNGAYHAAGIASWRDRVGEFEATFQLKNGEAKISDEYGCSLDLAAHKDYILISNSQGCGGMNVTFDGRYTREE
jgi:hypothetical protein